MVIGLRIPSIISAVPDIIAVGHEVLRELVHTIHDLV